jgi:peptide deformylase
MMRISVDRYPGEPERSNALYRARPLTWEQLGLIATCDGEPMHWQVKADRDAFKEAWLLLENDQGRFPLYPGQHAAISYSYTVDDGRWGPWFQRAIRLPTARVAVDLVFPASLDPVVWGTETSTTAEAIPLRTPPVRSAKDECTVFSWAADDPPMGARYRLEWRFRARPSGNDTARPPLRTASERMTAAGITQAGDPVLTQQAGAFGLPAEADLAREVIDALFAALGRVREHHVFGKGMGIAAPQIGIARAAAIVIPPDPAAEPLILLNPRVISESVQTDEQYEGCLSFFDVRGNGQAHIPRNRPPQRRPLHQPDARRNPADTRIRIPGHRPQLDIPVKPPGWSWRTFSSPRPLAPQSRSPACTYMPVVLVPGASARPGSECQSQPKRADCAT